MAYSHNDKVCGINGLAVGEAGAEVVVASATGGLYQSGTAVTASAAELNIMDGVTATTAELNIMDGVTSSATELNLLDGSVAGTAVASKALVLGANKNVDVLAVADLKLGAAAGTSVTSTAAELNLLDGSVAGTAVASKALVLGTNKNVDVLAIADLKLGSDAGTSVTSTAAELNILDGVTMTATQINLLTQGVEAGYKISRGTAAVDAASKDIVTGLATVVGVVVSMVGDPSLTHMYSSATVGDQAGAPAAGSIRIKSWKPTATGDVTPTAASSPFGNVAWVAIGT